MTRSKDIGTRAETQVVRFLAANGWPSAERRALHGSLDQGDVTGTPGLVWEVKGGEAAKCASDKLISAWFDECRHGPATEVVPAWVDELLASA